LNWTQYRALISIEDEEKMEYYIAESVKKNWTSRQLERQINGQLYERLLLSNDKESISSIFSFGLIRRKAREVRLCK